MLGLRHILQNPLIYENRYNLAIYDHSLLRYTIRLFASNRLRGDYVDIGRRTIDG